MKIVEPAGMVKLDVEMLSRNAGFQDVVAPPTPVLDVLKFKAPVRLAVVVFVRTMVVDHLSPSATCEITWVRGTDAGALVTTAPMMGAPVWEYTGAEVNAAEGLNRKAMIENDPGVT